jgi:hypothetical protein
MPGWAKVNLEDVPEYVSGSSSLALNSGYRFWATKRAAPTMDDARKLVTWHDLRELKSWTKGGQPKAGRKRSNPNPVDQQQTKRLKHEVHEQNCVIQTLVAERERLLHGEPTSTLLGTVPDDELHSLARFILKGSLDERLLQRISRSALEEILLATGIDFTNPQSFEELVAQASAKLRKVETREKEHSCESNEEHIMQASEKAIECYTGTGFRLINLARRSPHNSELGEMLTQQECALLGVAASMTKLAWAFKMAELLLGALKKMPRAEATSLYRGVDVFDSFRFCEGAVLQEKGFLSTSIGNPLPRQVLIVYPRKDVTAKGVRVSELSKWEGEGEVLFAPPTCSIIREVYAFDDPLLAEKVRNSQVPALRFTRTSILAFEDLVRKVAPANFTGTIQMLVVATLEPDVNP